MSSILQLRPGMSLADDRLQPTSAVVSRSPLCPAARPRTPKAPRAGQRARPSSSGRGPSLCSRGQRPALTVTVGWVKFCQALAYPLTAIAAAAGAAMEVVQQVLPLLADDQWADWSDGSHQLLRGDEVETEEGQTPGASWAGGPKGAATRRAQGQGGQAPRAVCQTLTHGRRFCASGAPAGP